jgi:hypothetical protein
MKSNNCNINYHYDKKSDVLYAIIGEPRSTKSREEGNGISIRIDINTQEIVGFIIIDYMKRIERNLLNSIPYFKNVSLPIKNLN